MGKNKYPRYSDGNILTSEALNRSFDFLHEQVKDTRRLMLGSGVLNGLGYSYNDEQGGRTLTIRPGMAITPSGMLIELPEERSYRFVKKENANEYTLVEDPNEEPLKNVTPIDQFVLGLRIENHEVTEQYCTSQSCTMKGTEMLIEIVPFLIRKGNGGQSANKNATSTPLLTRLDSVSMGDVVEYPALPVFLKRVSRHFEQKRSILIGGLDSFIKVVNFVPDRMKSFKDDCNALKKRLTDLYFNNTQSHQFHAFAEDLLLAFNEFIDAYNNYHSRYDAIETYDGSSSSEDNVLLGTVDSATSFHSVTSALGKNAEETIIQRMFERIKLMINNFEPEIKSTNESVLIPIKANSKLGERMIPAYYKATEEFNQYWVAHNESPLSPKQRIEKSDYQQADSFVLAFTKDMSKKNIISKLEKEIKANRISLLKLEYGLMGDRRIYRMMDYPEEKISITDKDVNDVVALMGETLETQENIDVNKYLSTFSKVKNNINDKKYDIESFKSLTNVIDNLDDNVINTIVQAEDNKLKTSFKKIFEYIILAYLFTKQDCFQSLQTYGMDYINGVEYGSILMLIIDKESSIIFAINVPASSILLNDKLLKEIQKVASAPNELDLATDF